MNNKYDIIGDIHGYYDELVSLLIKLDYTYSDGSWKHPDRKVLFIGDFVDRGPKQRAVVDLVRGMIDQGDAQAIMGNHEFNAIAFHTERVKGSGDYMRSRTNNNITQHKEFLSEFARKEDGRDLWADTIEWFKTLPLWLELDGIRLVHACWEQSLIDGIESAYGSNLLSEELLAASTTKGSWEYEALEVLLKGKEVNLPEGIFFHDKEGIQRHNMRVKWWDANATTYKAAYLGPDNALDQIPDSQIEGDDAWVSYAEDEKPVFIGHYWMNGTPDRLAKNIACTDYSVAKPGGLLVAYRWDGETTLSSEKFISINRI